LPILYSLNYGNIYEKILKFAEQIHNDRLRYLTELIYGEYLLRLGAYDVAELRKVLKEIEHYLIKVPDDEAVRKGLSAVRNLLDQKEKLQIRERLTKFVRLRR